MSGRHTRRALSPYTPRTQVPYSAPDHPLNPGSLVEIGGVPCERCQADVLAVWVDGVGPRAVCPACLAILNQRYRASNRDEELIERLSTVPGGPLGQTCRAAR